MLDGSSARFFGSNSAAAFSHCVEAVAGTTALVYLIPVSVFVGRAPVAQTGWLRALFSEQWQAVRTLRRAAALLINGRDTVVHFGRPLPLHTLMGDAARPMPLRVRRVARLVRQSFRAARMAVLGPDLSHRRTLATQVLNAPSVRAAIEARASREHSTLRRARESARRIYDETASDYTHSVVRSLSLLLAPLWKRLFERIDTGGLDALSERLAHNTVIYVPCHRSHVDSVLLPWLLYSHGLPVPSMGSGANLDMPLIGTLLRRSGVFFLRRSFSGDPLYSAVFAEYLSQQVIAGVPMAYFIEGGRSRTGRLLPARHGLLTITVRAFLRAPRRNLLFQPVLIDYERVVEEQSYLAELLGAPKKLESLLGMLRALRILRGRYGRVCVTLGEPIALTQVLDHVHADWRDEPSANKPAWLSAAVEAVGEQIQHATNAIQRVNATQHLAMALLGDQRPAMAESALHEQLAIQTVLLPAAAVLSPAEIVTRGEALGWVKRARHPLGDILQVCDERVTLLGYYRNNVLHHFVGAAWLGFCLSQFGRISERQLRRLGRQLYPFLRAEFHLAGDADEFDRHITAGIEQAQARGMLKRDARGRLQACDDRAANLRALARGLNFALQRYAIVLVALQQRRGELRAGALEAHCHAIATRLALLHEPTAPEFFQRDLFRIFIQGLRAAGFVVSDADERLSLALPATRLVRHAAALLPPEARRETSAKAAT